jgi:hypothetical protein
MSLVKIPAPVAAPVSTGAVRALPASVPPPLPPPAAASNASPDVAALMAQLKAAQDALASEKARADAAEKAKAAGRGYSMKASEKGCISIYGVSTRFPITLYAPHLVGIVRDLIMTGKAAAFLSEHANALSVKVDGSGQAGTAASVAEVRRLADELKRVTGK